MIVARGGWLLLLLMLGLTIYDMGRTSFRVEKKPALPVSESQKIKISLLGTGGRIDGIHQINDALQLIDVINLAGFSAPQTLRRKLLAFDAVENGKEIKLQVVEGVVVDAEFGFMPAAMRMSLAIPLDVNQMAESDWEDLPGVGPSLALRIISDRQKNGEFSSVNDLRRVNGVGVKRIREWMSFFSGS